MEALDYSPLPAWLPRQQRASLCFKLAGHQYSFEGIPAGWQRLLPPRLAACMVTGTASSQRVVRVEMSSDNRLRPPDESHDLNLTTYLFHGPRKVKIDSDWCEAHFNIAMDAPIQLLVHIDAAPWFGGVIENLLRVLVAYDVLQRGGVMLHCAAITKNDQAVVMFGHSGAGKSTTSALALENGCSVISDDINIIEPGNNGWQVTPLPFSGTLNAKSDIVKPVLLRGLFRLHKASLDKLEPCSAARAVSLLAGSTPFINQDAHRSEQLVNILTRLCADIPVQDLYFTRSHEFLRHVFSEVDHQDRGEKGLTHDKYR